MALLDEAGDAAGALAAHDAFRSRLQELYELEPSAETNRIVGLIRSRRPCPAAAAPPRPAALAPRTDPAPARPAPVEPRRRRLRIPDRFITTAARRWRWKLPAGATVVTALLIAAVVSLGDREPSEGQPVPLMDNRVAVLYLDVRGETKELRYLADGLTEALIGYLGQARNLDVVSPNGVEPFREMRAPLDTITARLRAATVIEGSLAQADGVTGVTLHVMDGKTGRLIKTVNVQSASDDLFGTINDVTTQVAEALGPVLGQLLVVGRWRAGTTNPRALEQVLRAGELQKLLVQQARDGEVSGPIRTYEYADSILALAARLDPDWPEPPMLRGSLASDMAWMCMFEPSCFDQVVPWLVRAADHATEAVRMRPIDAAALETRGRALFERWAWESDPDPTLLDRAETDLDAAITIDQSRAGALAARSAVFFAKADFSMAEATAERALAEDAFLDDRAEIQMRLFNSAFHRGHDRDADRWCAAVRKYQRGHWMGADCTLNLMAWSTLVEPDPDSVWLTVGNGLLHDPESLARAYHPRLELLAAAVLARAGMGDSARSVIERAVSQAAEDPELMYFEAAARVALGELDSARTLIQRYISEAPTHRQHVKSYRWFESLGEIRVAEMESARRW
jgi:TolB-like protein/tetratricopeptide (TPR) repeat protein